jgi:hypothetical protein
VGLVCHIGTCVAVGVSRHVHLPSPLPRDRAPATAADVSSQRCITTFPATLSGGADPTAKPASFVSSVAVDGDENWLAAACGNGVTSLFHVSSRVLTAQRTNSHGAAVRSVRFHDGEVRGVHSSSTRVPVCDSDLRVFLCLYSCARAVLCLCARL